MMHATSQPSLVTPLSVIAPSKVNWPHVAWFLGMAFGLSWLADLVLYLNGGLASQITALLLQFQMLLPAFSAMLLGTFFFRESPMTIQLSLKMVGSLPGRNLRSVFRSRIFFRRPI
jgi:hypothetical protein